MTGSRVIRVSEDVWQHVAYHGRYGETPGKVLERLLKVGKKGAKRGSRKIKPRANHKTP